MKDISDSRSSDTASSQQEGREEILSWSHYSEDSILTNPKSSFPSTIALILSALQQLPLINKGFELRQETGVIEEGSAMFSSFTRFRLQYILAYMSIMLADGLQGKCRGSLVFIIKSQCVLTVAAFCILNRDTSVCAL